MTVLTDTQREIALEAEVFSPLPDFPVVLDRTAVITIDMQYLDAHPDYGLAKQAKEKGKYHLLEPFYDDVVGVVRSIQRLHEAARQTGVELIHVRIQPTTEDSRDCPPITRMKKFRYPKSSRENDFLDEVSPVGDEIALTKLTSGAFASTPLALILRNLGIDTLIFCGVITNGCVETSVREARDLGFLPIVASDGCATWTRELHERSLRFMGATVCNVRTTDELVSKITTAARGLQPA